MKNLFSNQPIKNEKKDVSGYYCQFCGDNCYQSCTARCSQDCSGACTWRCGSACSSSSWYSLPY